MYLHFYFSCNNNNIFHFDQFVSPSGHPTISPETLIGYHVRYPLARDTVIFCRKIRFACQEGYPYFGWSNFANFFFITLFFKSHFIKGHIYWKRKKLKKKHRINIKVHTNLRCLQKWKYEVIKKNPRKVAYVAEAPTPESFWRTDACAIIN